MNLTHESSVSTKSEKRGLATVIAKGTVIAAFALAAACSKRGGDSAGGDSAVPTEPPVPQAALEGDWQSTCVSAEGFGISESTALEITPSALTSTTRKSREGDCSIEDVRITTVSRYNNPNPNEPTGTVELVPISVKVQAVTPVGASMLRMKLFCGQKEWIVGQEMEVTDKATKKNKDCVQLADSREPRAYERQDERLYFSKKDGQRPTDSAGGLFYVRK